MTAAKVRRLNNATAQVSSRKRQARTKVIDPTATRLSKYFLLSDFMGNHSIYRQGLHNRITAADRDKLDNGIRLALTMDMVEEHLGFCRVGYGYISPSLSQTLVTYQDPNIPSFHRWDLGAACDFRSLAYENEVDLSPIRMACGLSKHLRENLEYARMITYAESSSICLAVSGDPDQTTHRLYENRYVSGGKPEHIKWTGKEDRLLVSIEENEIDDNWRGAGYPRSHSLKIRQAQHVKMADTVLLSDLLYSNRAMYNGRRNLPPWFASLYNVEHVTDPCGDVVCANLLQSAAVVDEVQKYLGYRVSVTGCYESDKWSKDREAHHTGGFTVTLVMPEDVLEDTMESVYQHIRNKVPGVTTITRRSHGNVIQHTFKGSI